MRLKEAALTVIEAFRRRDLFELAEAVAALARALRR